MEAVMHMRLVGCCLALLTLVVSVEASAQQRVQGHTRSDGTYVQPYTRSTPNNSYNDNYSTRGNSNPYTGQTGTNSPTYNNRSPSYNQNQYGDPMRQPSTNSRSRW
jgi:hypothetical protein